MTGKIIQLEQFKVGCRHPANGLRFPHIYRVTGFEFELAGEELVPGTTRAVEAFYTLSDEGDFGVVNAAFTPIKTLDPGVDTGWIIVRHRASLARAEAYIDCVGDSGPPHLRFRTDAVADGRGDLHAHARPAIAGCPDHLIAYITKVAAEGLADVVEDAFHIVHADGTASGDPDVMFPCE